MVKFRFFEKAKKIWCNLSNELLKIQILWESPTLSPHKREFLTIGISFQILWPSHNIFSNAKTKWKIAPNSGLLRIYEIHIEFMLRQWKKQSWEKKMRMLIQNLFQLIVTDYSAMHCYYSCGLPNCLTSKVSKLAQNWGSQWPWYAIIVIFLHYWRAIFFVLWPSRRSSWCVTPQDS